MVCWAGAGKTSQTPAGAGRVYILRCWAGADKKFQHAQDSNVYTVGLKTSIWLFGTRSGFFVEHSAGWLL